MRPSSPRRAALVLAATSLCLVPFALAQTHTAHKAAAAKPAKMTNDDVLGLAAAGLDDTVIIAKIKAAPATDFDTSVAGLKALKAGSVSSNVIRIMIDPTAPAIAAAPPAAAAAPPPAAAPVVADNPDDPNAAHTPGIYMLAIAKDGKTHLTKLDHITAKQTKSSGAFLSGMTYGITKAHVKVAIDNDKANVATTEKNPVFYAYIPEDNNSFGGSSLSIRDFTLIRLDPKANSREVNTATISPWGMSSGTDQKAKQGFTSEQVRTGVYKLALDQPLSAGQYAFQHQNYGAFFDFGIIPSE